MALASLITLTACSSGGSDDGAPASETEEGADTSENLPDTDADTTNPTEDNQDQGTTALFGPAQYIVSDCGSLPIATTVADNNLDAPAQLIVGEPVSGQVVPGSTESNYHLWQVTLEPGNYHLVADASTLEDAKGTVGLVINSLGSTTSEDVILTSDSTYGYDLRLYEYLEIQATQTLTLKVDSPFDKIHNYTIGLFANGTAVPSPSFDRCLPINALSTGSTQSILLGESQTRSDQVWYRLDLENVAYTLDASTGSVDSDTLGYTFAALEQFGQADSETVVSADSEYGTLLITQDTFQPGSAGGVWLKAESAFQNDITVEFTLSAP